MRVVARIINGMKKKTHTGIRGHFFIFSRKKTVRSLRKKNDIETIDLCHGTCGSRSQIDDFRRLAPRRASRFGAVSQEEKAAMTKLRSSGELTAAAKRAWEDLQQEMVREICFFLCFDFGYVFCLCLPNDNARMHH